MSEIAANLFLDLRATLLDLERRPEQAAPGSEGAFADLLRTCWIPQPPTSAAPFEANDLVGRATSLPPQSAPESMGNVALQPDACRDANPIALQLRSSLNSPGFMRLQTPSEDAVPGPQLSPMASAARETPLADSFSATQAREPMPKPAGSQALAGASSQAGMIGAVLMTPAGPNVPAAGAPVGRPLPSSQQPPQQVSAPAAARPPSPRQDADVPAFSKPDGDASREKVRNLILELARQQANSSAVRIAIVVVESGVRVIARVGTLQETEKLRLKESIAALLAESGLTDAGVIIQTAPQTGSSSREG